MISRDGFIVESNKNLIFALRYILKWSRRCLVLSYRRLLLPVASSYTVLTPVWNINVSTVSITECNATGKRNRFLFLLLTQFSYVKIPPPTTYQLSKKFIGYGHYELTISSSEGTKTIVTGSMDLIERLNSEIDKEKEEATTEAIALVLKSSL